MTQRGRIVGREGLWELTLDGDRIVRMESVDPGFRAEKADWILPGLFDLQVNGIQGIDYASGKLTVEEVRKADGLLAAKGISRYCPTVVTRDFDTLLTIMGRFRDAVEEGGVPGFHGIHMEGPYISSQDGYRGVHRKEFARDPDWAEFQRLQEASGSRIRLVTIAPERRGAVDFVRKAAGAGVKVAMGHTAAAADDVAAAVDAGLTLSTHLFNGCAQLVDRHRNTVYAQLSEDRLWACFIGDSHHIPLPTLKIALRAKGPGRSILVSDIATFSGLPDGTYSMEGNAVEVKNGGVFVKGSYLLSGAARTLDEDAEILCRQPEPGIAAVLAMASSNPARAMGIPEWAEIVPGRKGPIAVMSWDGERLRLGKRIGF